MMFNDKLRNIYQLNTIGFSLVVENSQQLKYIEYR